MPLHRWSRGSLSEPGGKPVAADADADWNGNNAAFTCPVCSKVFIVSAFDNVGRLGLHCPGCGKSTAYVFESGTAESNRLGKIHGELPVMC